MGLKIHRFIFVRNKAETRFNLAIHTKSIQKIFKYLVFGVLTTIINFCTFSLCLMADIHYMTGNVVAFVVSVIFAYTTNKRWVFSNSNTQRLDFHESIRFIGCRIFTLAVESVILYIFIKKMSLNQYGVKAAANIVVIVTNYILSEFIVFKKDKDGDKSYYE